MSPRILSVSWGRIDVEGQGRFKDVMLFPGGARSWDWGETGTRHNPGILAADVQEILDRGAKRIILSRGMVGRLQVSDEALRLLDEAGIPVDVVRTEEAVALYNDRRESEAVGGLFHSTC
jgi:hypothetical protein